MRYLLAALIVATLSVIGFGDVTITAPPGGSPSGPANSVQFNNAGSFGGSNNFQLNASSVTIVSSVTVTSNGLSNTTPGFFDVYRDGIGNAAGTMLFAVGSLNQPNQFNIIDQTATDFIRYGTNSGHLHNGQLGNVINHRITDDNANSQYVDFWNNGFMNLQTDNAGNGGKDILFSPQIVEAMRVSNTGGMIVSSSSTFKRIVGFIAPTTDTYETIMSTPSAVAGFFHVAVSTSGHFVTSGAIPTMGTCGSSPSVVGDDNQGVITVGGGVVTSCAMNFANTWGVGCNVACQESDNSTAVTGDISSLSPTSVTFGFSASLGGGVLYYRCGGSGILCR